jgi:hypothetical protein
VEAAQIVKSRLILNLVLLLALIAIGLYAYLRPTEEAKQGIRVSQLKREDVNRIRLQRDAKMDLQLEKRHETWSITAPYQTHAEPLQVDRLLDLTMATASAEFPAQDLSRYGLDPAPVTVTLNDQSFAFGDINEVTNEQYLASNGRVYLVRTYHGYSLPTTVAEMLGRKLLTDDEAPVEYDFGEWQAVRNDKGAWSIQGKAPAGNDVAPTPDELNIWVAEWQLASALSISPSDARPQGERVVIRFSNGESATFHVLEREPDVILLRVPGNMRYQLGADAGARLLDPYRVAQQ